MNKIWKKISLIYARFIEQLKEQPLLFTSVWVIQFSIVALILMSMGLAPSMLLADDVEVELVAGSAIEEEALPTIVAPEYVASALSESETDNGLPIRVVIDSVGVDTKVLNPKSTDITMLDEALLSGAVRYPGSGNLDDESNMFMFAHSSHLPVVNNQSFKAFNNLENLQKGDLIRVQSETKEYHYRVTRVDEVKAEDAWVEFNTGKKELTLSTCDNFGSKQDRFVVRADFLGSFELDA